MTAAQSIRQAALSWPLGFLSDEETDIVWLYCGPGEYETFERFMNEFQSRIFMLLVAEELDGGAGREAVSKWFRVGNYSVKRIDRIAWLIKT